MKVFLTEHWVAIYGFGMYMLGCLVMNRHRKRGGRMTIKTINNKELANYLLALAVMCANEETDNCDITITTSKGKINCHIEFSEIEDGENT